MRIIFLDAGPLGLLAHRVGRPLPDRCREWVENLTAAGVRVYVPEIADYEVRRELLRLRLSGSVVRLDQVKKTLDYDPLTTDVMLRAAELWATVRRGGMPTAPAEALDCDCILAALAILAPGPGDTVTVATGNVGHLARFVDAQPWETITGQPFPVGLAQGRSAR